MEFYRVTAMPRKRRFTYKPIKPTTHKTEVERKQTTVWKPTQTIQEHTAARTIVIITSYYWSKKMIRRRNICEQVLKQWKQYVEFQRRVDVCVEHIKQYFLRIEDGLMYHKSDQIPPRFIARHSSRVYQLVLSTRALHHKQADHYHNNNPNNLNRERVKQEEIAREERYRHILKGIAGIKAHEVKYPRKLQFYLNRLQAALLEEYTKAAPNKASFFSRPVSRNRFLCSEKEMQCQCCLWQACVYPPLSIVTPGSVVTVSSFEIWTSDEVWITLSEKKALCLFSNDIHRINNMAKFKQVFSTTAPSYCIRESKYSSPFRFICNSATFFALFRRKYRHVPDLQGIANAEDLLYIYNVHANALGHATSVNGGRGFLNTRRLPLVRHIHSPSLEEYGLSELIEVTKTHRICLLELIQMTTELQEIHKKRYFYLISVLSRTVGHFSIPRLTALARQYSDEKELLCRFVSSMHSSKMSYADLLRFCNFTTFGFSININCVFTLCQQFSAPVCKTILSYFD